MNGIFCRTAFYNITHRAGQSPDRYYFLSIILACSLAVAVIMLVQVGITHLTSPDDLVYMIEEFMAFPYELVILTGITEIVLALQF